MRDIWGTTLHVRGGDTNAPHLEVVAIIREWLHGHTGRRFDLSRDGEYDADGRHTWWRSHDEALEAHVNQPFAPGIWEDITAACVRERKKVRVTVRVALRADVVPTVALPVVSAPELVPALLARVSIHDGGTRLRHTPVKDDQGSIPGLVHLLRHSGRRHPVICVSRYRGQALLDTDRLTAMFAGQAHIRELVDRATTDALSQALGRRLGTSGGTVRVYWPGMDRRDDAPTRHRYWRPKTLLRDPGLVVADLRSQINDYTLLTAGTHSPVSMARSYQRRESARASTSPPLGSASPQWLAWAHDLEQQRDALDAEVTELRDQLARMAELLEPGRQFASVADALEQAEAEASAAIIYLPEAHSSAAESPYANPDRLYYALRVLNAAADRFANATLPGGFQQFFRSHGLSYVDGASVTAVGRWPGDYRRSFEGRTITLGPHLRLGAGPPRNCCRIYWWVDRSARRLVIGHVGQHLRTLQSEG